MTAMLRRSQGLVAPTLLAALVAVPATATAAPSPDLWATVNICDTARNPNTLGIRASMPGNGTNQRMSMRFEAQFFDREVFVPINRSPWISAGSARFESAQRGYSFPFDQPPAGGQFLMRGRVDFRWRARRGRPGHRRWVTVLRRKRYTRAGFLGVKEGDPPGRSEAVCVIR